MNKFRQNAFRRSVPSGARPLPQGTDADSRQKNREQQLLEQQNRERNNTEATAKKEKIRIRSGHLISRLENIRTQKQGADDAAKWEDYAQKAREYVQATLRRMDDATLSVEQAEERMAQMEAQIMQIESRNDVILRTKRAINSFQPDVPNGAVPPLPRTEGGQGAQVFSDTLERQSQQLSEEVMPMRLGVIRTQLTQLESQVREFYENDQQAPWMNEVAKLRQEISERSDKYAQATGAEQSSLLQEMESLMRLRLEKWESITWQRTLITDIRSKYGVSGSDALKIFRQTYAENTDTDYCKALMPLKARCLQTFGLRPEETTVLWGNLDNNMNNVDWLLANMERAKALNMESEMQTITDLVRRNIVAMPERRGTANQNYRMKANAWLTPEMRKAADLIREKGRTQAEGWLENEKQALPELSAVRAGKNPMLRSVDTLTVPADVRERILSMIAVMESLPERYSLLYPALLDALWKANQQFGNRRNKEAAADHLIHEVIVPFTEKMQRVSSLLPADLDPEKKSAYERQIRNMYSNIQAKHVPVAWTRFPLAVVQMDYIAPYQRVAAHIESYDFHAGDPTKFMNSWVHGQ